VAENYKRLSSNALLYKALIIEDRSRLLSFTVLHFQCFWQQHAVLRDFYTHTPSPPPHPLKNGTRLLYCILKIVRLLYCVLKKAGQKAGIKKLAKKSAKKVAKKAAKKAAKKVAKKFIPKPVLLLSWNRSKTGLVPS